MNRSIRRLLGVVVTVTLVVHSVLAAGVVAHARSSGRDDGPKWALATLLGGLLGVAGYVRADD
ncbi:hypothetical protein SAMN04487949_3075 [Halogranum gelatinilyticum]|uniref:Uncharacterized protein n=1 Tax=Halogranum gelatinilyticum TaxID=660521 RepID=A0A1G9XPK5_9EURY|nr:hypothetical protein [Halogranum gelatinilyticum]SDM98660.1 hypothetical protein SAMN04487949_3075 [Halogranum gelatinilyticum]